MASYLQKIREQGKKVENSASDKRGTGYDYTYNPSKRMRKIRAHIWDRFDRMKNSTIRKEAEQDWEQGDKFARLWRPEKDPDDWRADIRLPDAFAAIQTHQQETVQMKIRPGLEAMQGGDSTEEFYGNAIMSHNMDRTGYDLENAKSSNCAATRGTAFLVEEYLLEKRRVKLPTGIDSDGKIEYKQTEIVDKDDTYTIHWPNERIYIDEAAGTDDEAEDIILEERMRYDTFRSRFGDNPLYFDTEHVIPVGSLKQDVSYFERADDMDGDCVQVLRYYNKITDSYQVMANTVVIRNDPIPYMHKQLPFASRSYYPVEGRIYGMGIPKIIAPSQEEREAIRNLSIDRQKMHLNKMFLVSDLFDLDEEEATTRPHGFIHVNAGGMSLDNVIRPLEYGDVPGSSIRMDDQLREDQRRVTGIDDRSQGVNMGGTATEAAILTEQSQKRINLINTLTGLSTIERLGRLKWSNIQFIYKSPRVEKILKDGEERSRKVYRKIKVDGKEFNVVKDEAGRNKLDMSEINGASSFKIDRTFASFMEHDFDVKVKFDFEALMPRSIRQQRTMEFFNNMLGNPMTAAEMNIRRSMRVVMREFGFDPKVWMLDQGSTDEDQMAQAMYENQLMMKGVDLPPTEGASEAHTLVHLWFSETEQYAKLPEGIRMIFERHIMGENENGPGGGAAGGAEGSATAGMEGIPGLEAMGGGDPAAAAAGGAPGQPNLPPPPPPEVMAALAATAGQQANGGQVTQQMAPLNGAQ